MESEKTQGIPKARGWNLEKKRRPLKSLVYSEKSKIAPKLRKTLKKRVEWISDQEFKK